mgnify:CR=1 FL=1
MRDILDAVQINDRQNKLRVQEYHACVDLLYIAFLIPGALLNIAS